MASGLAASAGRRTATAVIPLTRGLMAVVDAEDETRVHAAGKWYAKWSRRGRRWYAFNAGAGYLHRFILRAADDRQVDHRNLDGLDCRKLNLREATQSQNGANRGKARGCSSRFKGVDTHCGKFRARVKKDGCQITLGHFDCEEDAALAYDEAARELHGEFARLNFPRSRRAA